MKEGWIIKPFGDVAEFVSGNRPQGGVSQIRNGALSLGGEHVGVDGKLDISTPKFVPIEYYQSNQKGHIKSGDILLCKDGALSGKVALEQGELLNIEAMVNEHVFIIRTSKIAQKYLFYYLFSPFGQSLLKGIVTGAAQGGINGKNLRSIPVIYPVSINSQKQIVSEFDTLISIIDKKQQQVRDFDALIQSIFYEMFGDPANSSFPVNTLSSLSKQKLSYGSGASAVDFDGETRYVRITDIKDDGSLTPNAMSPSVFDEKYVLNNGDVLFARSGATVGKTFLYTRQYGKAIYAGYLIRFVPDVSIVLPEYIFHYTRSEFYKAFVRANAQAVAQPNINAQQYGSLKVCVPPMDLQLSFEKRVSSINAAKASIKQSIEECQKLLDSRMHLYFDQ